MNNLHWITNCIPYIIIFIIIMILVYLIETNKTADKLFTKFCHWAIKTATKIEKFLISVLFED